MTSCRGCGHNSRTDDVCERCGTRLSLSAPPILAIPSQVEITRRVSLAGDVVESTQTMPCPAVGAGNSGSAARSSSQTLPLNPVGNGAARDPHQEVIPGGSLPLAIAGDLEYSGPSLRERWEKGLGMALPVLAVSMLVVHFIPAILMVVVLCNLLVLPIALCAAGIIPRYREAMLDSCLALVVTALLGPAVALAAYLLTTMVKQERNDAIVAILLTSVFVRGLFAITFAPVADTQSLAAMWGFFNWMSFAGVCMSLIGWLVVSIFRPVDV